MAGFTNPAKERLKKGEVALGCGVRLARTVEIAKVMAISGYDWLFIDMEHGSIDLDIACQMAVAALDAGIAPIARVPSGEFSIATRLLDGGAAGIVIPHVDTADQAREIVDRLKYPPQGHRSVAGAMAQLGYRPTPLADATRIVNAETLIIVMIETPRAVENAEAIAAVPGIDVLLIGTNDLSMELGIPGGLGDPKVVAAYERVIAACKRHGKHAGLGGVYTEDLMRQYIGMGTRLVLGANDFSLVLQGAQARAKFVRGLAG
ncbi:MAG TPA: aldolase/citrate lyase family protein [Stellaceae bacterium]|nr:aldolase/citrate lyase family protein [Stellaceae bacterium]